MDRFIGAVSWNLEQPYESKPRPTKKLKSQIILSSRLPIKTPDGLIQRAETVITSQYVEDEYADMAEDTKSVEGRIHYDTLSRRTSAVPEKRRLLDIKEDLARTASMITEDPEENITMTRRIRDMTENSSPWVQKLAIVTLLSIYKDIIPGYRIRPLSEHEQIIMVSKDVKKLRAFEQSLLSEYKQYIGRLEELFRESRKLGTKASKALASVAVNCACQLIRAVPHFNFRSELLKLLVEALSVKIIDPSFRRSCEALEDLFCNDENGNASFEAVQLLTEMFKAKKYRIDELVLNTFLTLRLLSGLDVKVSRDHDENPRKRKNDKEFVTKKARKLEKKNKEVEKEMKEADAIVYYEDREKMQSATLKMVFVTYFTILKERPNGLLGATLEGLAKFGHLINIDFFGDILVALKEHIEHSTAQSEDLELEYRNATRESLLCIITAFTLLRAQDEKIINVDLNFFTTHLYSILLPLCLDADIEYSQRRSMRLPDPISLQELPTKVNLATEIEMLIRTLDTLFFKQNRLTNKSRVAAFTKRLLVSSLQMPEKSTLANLGIVNKLGKKYHRKLAGLFNTEETFGDGVFKMEVDDPEKSNPYAATLWEAVLLEKHYSPDISQAVKGIAKTQKRTDR